MEASKGSKFEIKKRAEWWLDISKLTMGSIVFPAVFVSLDWYVKLGIFAFGLTLALRFSKIGFKIARSVEE